MENQEDIILEEKALKVLEKSKEILSAHKVKLIDITYKCRKQLNEQEKALRELGKSALQELTPKSEKIKNILKEIDIITTEINDI